MDAKADIAPLIDGELERVIAAEARARGYTMTRKDPVTFVEEKTAQRLADLAALAEAEKSGDAIRLETVRKALQEKNTLFWNIQVLDWRPFGERAAGVS
jgi:hypothetical protein